MSGIIRLKTDEESGKTVKYEWEPGVLFEVKDTTKEQITHLIDSCRDTTSRKRRKNKDDIDYQKFGKLFILKSVIGWENLKFKHLLGSETVPGIFDIKVFKFVPGTDPEAEFEFNKDNLRELSDLYSSDFMTFVSEAKDEITEILRIAREEDLKN